MTSDLVGVVRAHPYVAELLSRCQFPAATEPLVCAVSGGADSLALAVLAVANGNPVRMIHVDHGLRVGSDQEAAVVQGVAERLGADFTAVRVEITAGGDLEARARAARYGVLPATVCTGHTSDDQAETVLINMLRGAGLDGLAALTAEGPRHRPLLSLRRTETLELCRVVGLVPFHDPMNDDPKFLRVRVRNELLPLLGELAHRDVVPILARQARIAADDLVVLRAAAQELDPTDARTLAIAPVALARRSIRSWLVANGVTGDHPPSLAMVERVLSVAVGSAPRADLVAGWRVARRAQRLRLERVERDPDVPV
jgi:tRNA(Ile)-lysidine synthase